MSWLRGIAGAGLWLAIGGAGCEDQHIVIGALARGHDGGVAGAPERPRFEAPTAMTELNSSEREEDPTLTDDLREIYFMSDRGGNRDLWTSRRAGVGSPWDPPHARRAGAGRTAGEDTSRKLTTRGATVSCVGAEFLSHAAARRAPLRSGTAAGPRPREGPRDAEPRWAMT